MNGIGGPEVHRVVHGAQWAIFPAVDLHDRGEVTDGRDGVTADAVLAERDLGSGRDVRDDGRRTAFVKHEQLAADAHLDPIGRALGTHRLDLLGVAERSHRERPDDAVAGEIVDALKCAYSSLHRGPILPVDGPRVIAVGFEARLY